MTRIWISRTAFASLMEEADRAYPNETGGVLVGYHADNGDSVIFAVVGPGPDAVHLPRRFLPDHAWQCRQLEIFFKKSSGDWVYTGDWHTHPDGVPQMSWLDRRTLRNIAKHSQARTSHPMMLIGGGALQHWHWMAHQYCGDHLFGLLIESHEDKLHIFDQTRQSF